MPANLLPPICVARRHQLRFFQLLPWGVSFFNIVYWTVSFAGRLAAGCERSILAGLFLQARSSALGRRGANRFCV